MPGAILCQPGRPPVSDRAILIMAGGTGGHVYPALAVAERLRAKGFSPCWLGTGRGLEARVVPEQGYPLARITVSGLRGKGPWRRLLAPPMLLIALWQALRVLRRVRPVAALGMGGFASGPGGVAAWLLRIPLLIHEQNAVAGLTNRLLTPLAVAVLVAFPAAFQGRFGGKNGQKGRPRLIVCGNPVRPAIAGLPGPAARFAGRDPASPRLLILGGSLGAKRLNETLPEALAGIRADFAVRIRHQCGPRHLAATRAAYQSRRLEAGISAFIEDMAAAYAWADLVVCRAGALTISELAAAGVGAVLIPFPHAVDDHQTENARQLTAAGAALLLPEAELNPARLATLLRTLFAAPERLWQMAGKARALARPEAAEQVARRCAEAAHG